jgi:hypothetical protein
VDKKICVVCKLEKPLLEFIKDNRRKNGRGSRCLLCHSKAENARIRTPEGKESKKKSDATYRKNNLEKICVKKRTRYVEGTQIINSYKCIPCMDCGKTFPPDCMELDHVRGKKVIRVSALKFSSRDKLLEEILKCETVCAVCHRIRTENRREPSKEKRLLEHRAMIDEFKIKPCVDCELCFPPVAMDLDHVRGEKILEISNMGHYPRWKVIKELEKCDVVCANCHRIRTRIRAEWSPL